MSSTNQDCVVYGIDIGKSVFHVCGCDRKGKPVFRKKFSRRTVTRFFANVPEAVVGMEACPGSQWLARRLVDFGHDARIMPAQMVKPYLNKQKNDANDAEAIAEAVQRPNMRFVAIKRLDQVDVQALHRVRDRLVRQRTQIVAQARGLCLEYGLTMARGVPTFCRDLPRLLENPDDALTPRMLRILHALWEEFLVVNDRVNAISEEIKSIARHDETARRLMSVPGIGELTASAIVSSVGCPQNFKRGRDLAAWIGLVPAQHSTGGRTKLLGISKRGNPYLRRLLIHGARTAKLHLDRDKDRLGPWLNKAEARMPSNKVTVALANKLARIAWVILTRPGETYDKGVVVA
jgi:transposase